MAMSWWCIFPGETWRLRFIRAAAPCWKGELQIGRVVFAWHTRKVGHDEAGSHE